MGAHRREIAIPRGIGGSSHGSQPSTTQRTQRMKRWISLITIAIVFASLAMPATVNAGCSPSISGSANRTVSGNSGSVAVAAAASVPVSLSPQSAGNGGASGNGGNGTGGNGGNGGGGGAGG